MRYNLAAMARRRSNIRRKTIVIRDIVPPAALAGDLYAACYKPVVDIWTRAIPGIIEEYERTLSELTTDAPADIQEDITEAQQDFESIVLQLNARLRDWGLRVERWQRGKWRGAVLSATGVDIGTIIGPEGAQQTLDATIEWNVNLIRDVSEQARKRISDAVYSGLSERKPVRDVARDIREAVDMSRRRSIGIASDQLSKLTNALADERRREAGIDSWQWKSSHKKHFRPEHAARDGKVYTDKTAPTDLPGRLPYCGCRSLAVIDFDSE